MSNIGIFANQTGDLLYGYTNAKSQEHAVFLDLSYKPWNRLEQSAGARWYSTFVAGGFIGTSFLVRAENDGNTVNTLKRISERGLNPKFSATRHFSGDILTYALARKGFRFGGLQETPSKASNGVPPVHKSDTLWNYELGLRTHWLGDTTACPYHRLLRSLQESDHRGGDPGYSAELRCQRFRCDQPLLG